MTQDEDMTPEKKERLNDCYRMLKHRRYTKAELQHYFQAGERQIRFMISAIRKKAPVIAPSCEKGYRIATKPEDMEDVYRQYGETVGRIVDLMEGLPALRAFVVLHGGNVRRLARLSKVVEILRAMEAR